MGGPIQQLRRINRIETLAKRIREGDGQIDELVFKVHEAGLEIPQEAPEPRDDPEEFAGFAAHEAEREQTDIPPQARLCVRYYDLDDDGGR